MSELSFLIQLLLNDDVPVKVKLLLADRIKEVETNLVTPPAFVPDPIGGGTYYPSRSPNNPNRQAPSTQAALERHGLIPDAAPVPVEQIAQTPAAAAALAQRSAIIAGARSGKPQDGATSPHKFRGQLRD